MAFLTKEYLRSIVPEGLPDGRDILKEGIEMGNDIEGPKTKARLGGRQAGGK
jgi:hypothetical protein